MAAKLGLEPRQTESESAGLPLHHCAPEPKMAEKEGFEPSRRSKPTYSLSRGAPSTTWVLLQAINRGTNKPGGGGGIRTLGPVREH